MRSLSLLMVMPVTLTLMAAVGCGGEPGIVSVGAAPTVSAAMKPDDFGSAFAGAIAWGAYKKSADGACTESIAAVNRAREGLAEHVQWLSVTQLNIWTETSMAWAAFLEAGCSNVGKEPDQFEAESALLPTKCDGLRQNVASGWHVVTTTDPYKAVVGDGTMGAVEQAYDAALSSGCIY